MLIETLKLWDGRDDVELTTFITPKNPMLPMLPKRPAVIVCPGGAYLSCPRHGDEGDPVAMAFAMDGYQAFVLEYSVVSRAPMGKTLFPAQLYDFGKAFLTIREHAEEWNVDVDRISIIGFSAGAHLCGMMATSWNSGLLSDYFGVPSEYFRPHTAMLIYGVLDYVLQVNEPGEYESKLPGDHNTPVFGTAVPDEETLRRYSPSSLVDEHTPPTFLAAARDDKMVNPKSTLHMALALENHHIPYELHMYEYGSHGFALGRSMMEPWRKDQARCCETWLEQAKTFLLHHNAPETTVNERDPFAAFDAMLGGAKLF